MYRGAISRGKATAERLYRRVAEAASLHLRLFEGPDTCLQVRRIDSENGQGNGMSLAVVPLLHVCQRFLQCLADGESFLSSRRPR